jgi:ATP-dependent DNA ligase
MIWPVARRGRPRQRHVPDILSIPAEDMLANAKWRTISWRTDRWDGLIPHEVGQWHAELYYGGADAPAIAVVLGRHGSMKPAGRVRCNMWDTKTDKLPSGDLWLHEIKHDGFRVIARKDGDLVRLYSRPGNEMTRRFPLIAEALTRLRSRSCIIDGEAIACDDNGHRIVRA